MRVVNIASLLLCAVVLSIFVPAMAHAKTVTVVLKNGKRLENIYYSVDKKFQVLRYDKYNHDKKNAVSLYDIEAIIDDNGENVAAEVLGKYYRPEHAVQSSPAPETEPRPAPATAPDAVEASAPAATDWRSEKDPVYITARRKPWSVGLQLGGDFSVPSGDWFRDVHSGIGFSGVVTVFLTRELGLRFRGSREGLHVDDNFYTEPLYQPGVTFYNESSSLTVTSYHLTAMYYHRVNTSRRLPLTLYTDLGLGLVHHKMKGSTWVTDGVETGIMTLDDSQTKFALPYGFGMILQLSQNIGLDAGARMDILFIGKTGGGGNGYTEYQSALMFDFNLGFIWLL